MTTPAGRLNALSKLVLLFAGIAAAAAIQAQQPELRRPPTARSIRESDRLVDELLTPEKRRDYQIRANTHAMNTSLTLDQSALFPGEVLCVTMRIENSIGTLIEIYEPDAFLNFGFEEYALAKDKEIQISPGDVPLGALDRPERTTWIAAGEVLTRRMCSWDEQKETENIFIYGSPGHYRLRNYPFEKSVDYEVVKPIVRATAAASVGLRVVSEKRPEFLAPAHRYGFVLEYDSKFYIVVGLHDFTGTYVPLKPGGTLDNHLGPYLLYQRIGVEESPPDTISFAGTPGTNHRLVWQTGTQIHTFAVPAGARSQQSDIGKGGK